MAQRVRTLHVSITEDLYEQMRKFDILKDSNDIFASAVEDEIAELRGN